MKPFSQLIGGIVAMTGLGASACGDAAAAGPAMTPTCAEVPTQAVGDGTFTASGPAYASCGQIPAAHTCDAKAFPLGSFPGLTWTAGPAGTLSYAVSFKDLSVLTRLPPTDANYRRGFHWAMWDIPATTTSLPAGMQGGYVVTEVPGAHQWSGFNNYGFFGPCPNFDPTMPATNNDVYAFTVYAIPTATVPVPAPSADTPVKSTQQQMDDYFKSVAIAVAEYRGTSFAHASVFDRDSLPDASPPCPTTGTAPAGCLPAQ